MTSTNTTTQPRRGRGLAISALILGIVGVGVGFIPFLFILTFIVAVLALILGAIGWRGARVIASVGIAAGALAFTLGIVGFNATSDFVDDVDDAVTELEDDLDTP